MGELRALSSASSFKALSEFTVAGEHGSRRLVRWALRAIRESSIGEGHDGASRRRSLIIMGGGIGAPALAAGACIDRSKWTGPPGLSQ
eukprot:CAMPEP_0115827838 /NCGR_PEP_ID=MMETSP0287-20121206/258_1 /TAXON_ID=412157 /ORGANISM="Chrysochromulina rotalis, Strain UIO044" /LENGTH=87 /DNA_ID=CAMNT_0003281023 /DNA_START=613 /DNA_END=873 /DNA_ORIENTATION=+